MVVRTGFRLPSRAGVCNGFCTNITISNHYCRTITVFAGKSVILTYALRLIMIFEEQRPFIIILVDIAPIYNYICS